MGHKKEFEAIDDNRGDRLKQSIEDPPVLEFKELPTYLEYAFVGKGVTLLVVIASTLKKDQKEKLLNVLDKHRRL